MDEAFLQELDEYRDRKNRPLVQNRNPELDGETLTELTQRTLDRPSSCVSSKTNTSSRRTASPTSVTRARHGRISSRNRASSTVIYNGIVYKEHAILDNRRSRWMTRYSPTSAKTVTSTNSRHDFNAVPIHILGSIYEAFACKVITTTEKRAKVEEKPEVRKAAASNTPEYIVRYIVENTVGKLIEGKTRRRLRNCALR